MVENIICVDYQSWIIHSFVKADEGQHELKSLVRMGTFIIS